MPQAKQALIVLLTGMMTLSPIVALSAEATPPKPRNDTSDVIHLAGLFKRKVRPAGTRGPICIITPGLGGDYGEHQVWSDRPIFVWQSGRVATQIQVRLADSKELVWSQLLAGHETSVTYGGVALKPGETYEVILLNDRGKSLVEDQALIPKFTLLDVASRARVTNALAEKERQLSADQSTSEEIVAAKAQYLLDHDLISDAFQVVYSDPSHSPKLKAIAKQVAAIACGDEELSASSH